MNKKTYWNLLSLLIIMSAFYHHVNSKTVISQLKSHKTTTYFGSLINLTVNKFCVLYDGQIIDIMEGGFSIKDQLLAKINILFVDVEKIQFCLEEHNVQELCLATDDYLFFELEITQFVAPSDLNHSYSSSWKIIENKLTNKIIPLNTIIIPIDPKLVNIKLQNVVSKPSNLAVKLPNILLASKNSKPLKELITEGYLKTISLKPFFSKQQIKSINQNTIKISLII